MRPPQGSLLADEKHSAVLPWTDVMIDIQGPYTRSEGGEYQYVLSYHCTRLKVPKLAVVKSLQAGYFSRALVQCVMAASKSQMLSVAIEVLR